MKNIFLSRLSLISYLVLTILFTGSQIVFSEESNGKKEDSSTWTSPNYSGQEKFLGYLYDTFHKAAPGLEERVQFWVDVYSKYSTSDAVLHDSKYLNLVYKVVSFRDIEENKDLTRAQKESEKLRRIKSEKSIIKDLLLKLADNQFAPSRLSSEEKTIFDKFRLIDDKNKFLDASKPGRLRFQLGQSDQFKRGVFYSGRYMREMEKIFREQGLPVELTRLPFVESSFNIHARSHVGASGIWQFMKTTGKLFKLKVDKYVDQRNDPILATIAAAKLLKGNFELLGNWPLALTAYNHGPSGVARIKRRLKSEDINEIIWGGTSSRFGFASENFFSEFIAAVRVEENAQKFFGDLEVSSTLEYKTTQIPQDKYFSDICESLGVDCGHMRLLNPFLTFSVFSDRIPLPSQFEIRVPTDLDLSKVDYTKIGPKTGFDQGTFFYKVERGDSLDKIATEFGVSKEDLVKANNLKKNQRLKRGAKLVIPGTKQ